MTRGRSKDLSIPTSRALIQQRDYRARKAKYLSDLEERCRRAELENERLRKELDIARGGLLVRQSTFSSETAQATTELMQHLSTASASLARFQQLAFTDNQLLSSPSPQAPLTQSRPKSMPTPAASSPFSPATTSFYSPYDELNPQTESSSKPIDTSSNTDSIDHMRRTLSMSPESDERCCGGIIDCSGLIENESQEGSEDMPSDPLVKNSNMRSTSAAALIM